LSNTVALFLVRLQLGDAVQQLLQAGYISVTVVAVARSAQLHYASSTTCDSQHTQRAQRYMYKPRTVMQNASTTICDSHKTKAVK
jgi:hypothetical protein